MTEFVCPCGYHHLDGVCPCGYPQRTEDKLIAQRNRLLDLLHRALPHVEVGDYDLGLAGDIRVELELSNE